MSQDDDRTVLRPARPRPQQPADDDRTVMRPRPGGRGAGRPAAAPSGGHAPAPRSAPVAAQPATVPRGSGLNPLVDAAATLLSLVAQLRNAITQPDVAGLREHVAREMQGFDARARSQGVRADLVISARYGLCTVLDEMVLSTPWGSSSSWSQQSLLSTFHNETFGGEKFFQILDAMAKEPASNLEILELFYICLALGFEGKYRVLERGRARLEQIQDNLYRAIRSQRGEYEHDLSPHWQGVPDRRNALTRYVPLWVVGALAGLVLTAVYLGFSFALNDTSDPVFAALQGVGREMQTVVARPPPPPPPKQLDLAAFLAPEVRQGLVEIVDRAEGNTVLIRGDGLFASGSVTVKSDLLPLLARISEALDEVKGKVLVTGHTDSVPIRTLRFPSNWHLSQARAEAVVKVLAESVRDPSRLVAEGRAETQPVAPNDTPANRALNRRVEITLLARTVK